VNNKGSFEIKSNEGYLTVKLNGICDFYIINGLEEQLQASLGKSFIHVVVNCEYLVSLSSEWVRLLFKLQTVSKQRNRQMILVCVSSEVFKALKRDGVETAFTFSPNLKDALVKLGLVAKKTFDTEFINPFLNATLHVLHVQTGIEAIPQKIYLKSTSDSLNGDVSGIIAIVSDSFCGTVVISFPEITFLGIMSGMLGENYTELNKDIIDGAGEITNMIFGYAKTVLNKKGYGIKIAIPSVVTGKDHSLSAMTKGAVVVIPFNTSVGNFFVEVGLSA